jgi:hypothetical protein
MMQSTLMVEAGWGGVLLLATGTVSQSHRRSTHPQRRDRTPYIVGLPSCATYEFIDGLTGSRFLQMKGSLQCIHM